MKKRGVLNVPVNRFVLEEHSHIEEEIKKSTININE